MRHLTNLILDKGIREGTEKIVQKYLFVYQHYPCSFSGRFHPREKYLYQHVERCVYFAQHLLEEFNIPKIDRDIMISACILHDIGKVYCGYNVETTKFEVASVSLRLVEDAKIQYHKNGWSQNHTLQHMHPILSSLIIGAHKFNYSRRVQDLVEIHMSHWSKQACRQPDNVLHFIMCSADYLASRDIEVKL